MTIAYVLKPLVRSRFSFIVCLNKNRCVYACKSDHRSFTARHDISWVCITSRCIWSIAWNSSSDRILDWVFRYPILGPCYCIYIENKNFAELVIIDIRRRWCIRVLLVLQMVDVWSDSHSVPQYAHSLAWGMFFILVKFTPEYYKYINIFQWVQSNLF